MIDASNGPRFAVSFILLTALPAWAQQRADPDFDPKIKQPAFTSRHPRIVIDEAHHNFHTADGRYKPFADLLRADGCKVVAGKKKFSLKSLKKCDVLVIANAMGDEKMGSPRAESPAFTTAECDAVEQWVRQGGSLLLITDHYPMGSAASALAEKFGVDMSKGMTEEYTFTAESGLGEHVILGGRGESERVQKVGTFTGQSLKGPPGSTALFVLPADAQEQVPDEKDSFRNKPHPRSAKGRCQSVILRHGKGRVVVLGEAAMLTAQLSPEGRAFGMNVEGLDNRQFALNTIHWLCGLLDGESVDVEESQVPTP